jgi:hypothetical protein
MLFNVGGLAAFNEALDDAGEDVVAAVTGALYD